MVGDHEVRPVGEDASINKSTGQGYTLDSQEEFQAANKLAKGQPTDLNAVQEDASKIEAVMSDANQGLEANKPPKDSFSAETTQNVSKREAAFIKFANAFAGRALAIDRGQLSEQPYTDEEKAALEEFLTAFKDDITATQSQAEMRNPGAGWGGMLTKMRHPLYPSIEQRIAKDTDITPSPSLTTPDSGQPVGTSGPVETPTVSPNIPSSGPSSSSSGGTAPAGGGV